MVINGNYLAITQRGSQTQDVVLHPVAQGQHGIGELDCAGLLSPSSGVFERTGDGCVDALGSGLFQDYPLVSPARIYLNRRSSFIGAGMYLI